MQKQAVQFTKKPYLSLFSSETADKFARDYAIKKSFCHALHLVTAHLHLQNQVVHTLRTRDFWLASLSIHFPIHFAQRAHEYPVTLNHAHSEHSAFPGPDTMSPLERSYGQRERGNAADTHAIERELPLATYLERFHPSVSVRGYNCLQKFAIPRSRAWAGREELSDLPGSETPSTGFR